MKRGKGLGNTGGLRPNMYGMKVRGGIRRNGRITEERKERRERWIKEHPPREAPGGRTFYMCHICVYFGEKPSIALVWSDRFVLEHIEAKGHMTLEESQQDTNLGPAHADCNIKKGSQSLWQMKTSPKSGLPNPHLKESG